MTPEQTVEIMVKAKDSFQKWKDIDKYEFAEMIKTWHEILEPMPYQMANQAMKDYITDNTYPPTPADIYKPYKEYLESKKEKNKTLREIYYNTIDHYPCYSDTREIQNEWMRITGNDIGKAEQFKTQLNEYVRGCEMQGIDPIPFEDFMKGVKQIE